MIVLQPEDLQSPKPATGIARPETWNDDFKAWLSRETAGTSPGSRTTLVALGRSYLVYPIHSDPEGFHSTFGNIIKFRSDTRQIASAVFKNLVDLSPTVSWDGRSGTANGYMGIHLRTEKDAREGWPGQDWVWSRYETQSRAFLNQTIKSGLKTIYVASGDLSQISQLKSEAQSHGIEVKDKFELLSVPNRERLQSMPWDQQGLVDFLVLLKSQDFAGIAHSSFAWAIALKRHQMSRRLGGDESYLDGPQMLSDEFSQVYGQVRGYPEYAATLWP